MSNETTLIAQIAPQRSTQYAELADVLAPHELRLCAVGRELTNLRPLALAGQNYLQFELPHEPSAAQVHELGTLATLSAFFVYHETLAGLDGPFLQPLDPRFEPALPPDLVVTRRYRGKTNELFTHWLCNIAKFSSDLAERPWDTLRVFDPLAGGGTTLFTALMLGADVAGVEQNEQDVQSTAAFLAQYLREQRISHRSHKERLKGLGQRWSFAIGKKNAGHTQQCMLALGDTVQSVPLLAGFKPHLIVTDLPYGIQHHGQLTGLLTKALPVWESLLPPSGALAMAWDATRFSRAEMIACVESGSGLRVRNDPPYDAFAHRVDRVIKQRDVVVARPR